MRAVPSLPFSVVLLAIACLPGAVIAAGGDLGQAQKQPTNWTAILMFAAFVIFTLFITKWAAAKTKSAADFYTAGGGITGFQNGLAIFFSRHFRSRVFGRLRQPDLFNRLSGGLASHHFPDGRTPA